ncbi:hypothetical protein [Paenibacillus alkalitolerans]|uniref:hypothetical protein n=1 Tax=Paenibacillus alkalitolerans TaxID=2799335 RepID=UPI0018F5F81F|nr:hypothetical protein [Paenibacillus alkalitolerans]
MELIAPVSTQKCAPYIGKPVCAVLHDGSHVFGYLQRVDGGKLILSGSALGEGTVSVSKAKAKKQLKQKMDKAQTNFYSPYFYPPYFSPGLFALDLALIALLFTVPFFFFW